jgi:hypothetical protein
MHGSMQSRETVPLIYRCCRWRCTTQTRTPGALWPAWSPTRGASGSGSYPWSRGSSPTRGVSGSGSYPWSRGSSQDPRHTHGLEAAVKTLTYLCSTCIIPVDSTQHIAGCQHLNSILILIFHRVVMLLYLLL